MKLFGITGGIGMGKSTAGALLKKMGVAVVDTDRIARMLVEPGQPALAEIARVFGPSILSPNGRLDRRSLARRVFADAEERAQLESILHPKIREAWEEVVNTWRGTRLKHGAVIIPLLFETKAESHFDAVACVACGASTQSERLRERGWSREEIKQRTDSQWPVEEKMARADFIVWTDTTLEAHIAQLEKMLLKMSDTIHAHAPAR